MGAHWESAHQAVPTKSGVLTPKDDMPRTAYFVYRKNDKEILIRLSLENVRRHLGGPSLGVLEVKCVSPVYVRFRCETLPELNGTMIATQAMPCFQIPFGGFSIPLDFVKQIKFSL